VAFEFEILNKGFDDFPGNRVPLKFTFTLSCDYYIAEVNGADHLKYIDAKTWEITYESQGGFHNYGFKSHEILPNKLLVKLNAAIP
jgi:hypothetical protein